MAAKRKFDKAAFSAGIIGWIVALLMFFPILWMLLAAFKTEIDAVAPPKLFFQPTLENFAAVNQRADYFRYAMNSVIESFGATILSLLIAVPAAYAAAFFPGKRTKDLLRWVFWCRSIFWRATAGFSIRAPG
jgi:sorbitol/mannitol transport system permease protein